MTHESFFKVLMIVGMIWQIIDALSMLYVRMPMTAVVDLLIALGFWFLLGETPQRRRRK